MVGLKYGCLSYCCQLCSSFLCWSSSLWSSRFSKVVSISCLICVLMSYCCYSDKASASTLSLSSVLFILWNFSFRFWSLFTVSFWIFSQKQISWLAFVTIWKSWMSLKLNIFKHCSMKLLWAAVLLLFFLAGWFPAGLSFGYCAWGWIWDAAGGWLGSVLCWWWISDSAMDCS